MINIKLHTVTYVHANYRTIQYSNKHILQNLADPTEKCSTSQTSIDPKNNEMVTVHEQTTNRTDMHRTETSFQHEIQPLDLRTAAIKASATECYAEWI